MFFMDGFGNQSIIWTSHKPAKLGTQGYITHSGWNKNLVIYFMYSLADNHNIIRLLIRGIRNTDSAGQVDESNVCTGFFF